MSNRNLAPNTTLIIQDDCFPSCHPSYVRLPPGNAATGDWQKKNPFTSLQQWCVRLVLIGTRWKMILLPSHITCCAGFCINVLRIKNSMLQSYNKHIHTACHSKTCYNFYYSVICIITVASKATTSAYFFPLFKASSYFYTTKPDVDSYDASFLYLVSYANVCSHISVFTCKT